MATKIMVDSASDISQEEAKQLGIIVVPIEVSFGEEQYLDGVDLLTKDFYEKLTSGGVLPKTSQINPYRWEEEFKKATENGDTVVAIILSSKLSGTYQSALEAAKNFEGKVYVVDSLSAAIGERLLCEYAQYLIDNGSSARDVKENLDEVKEKISVKAMVDTLEYLKKGGRISAATAFVGGVLSIKPIVAVVDGEVKNIAKAMGTKKGFKTLTELVEKEGIDFNMPHGLIWSGNDNSMLEKYKKDCSALFEGKEMPEHIIGSTIGTHVGPGAVGIAYFRK